MVPKFQAIQAAHEILGDPAQKAKYDAERAKLNKPARDADSPVPTFKKPAPPRRTDSGYPNGNFPQSSSQQPPRRDPSATRYGPQTSTRRPNPAVPPGNDKFAQFARAAPQQRWDHAKFEEAARAEAYRGMNAMRGSGMPQTSPLRPRGHPTAPRSAGTGTDSYTGGPEPSPGFPGLGRTASGRRYNPGDEPQSRSAYAQYHRPDRDRPPSTGPYTNPEQSPHHGTRESNSPLRTTRSFQHEDFQEVRPSLSRTSSRYARTGGERTTLGTGNIGRSTSVRNSPIDKRWDDETGPFGTQHTPEERASRPRHRSHSPPRPGPPKFQFTSESSSEGDDSLRHQDRPKPSAWQPHGRTESSRATDDGLSGYFPKTNYNTRVVDDHTYPFPAPESKHTPARKTASNLGSPNEQHESHDRRTSQEDVTGSKYDFPSPFASRDRSRSWWPPWAIPSSIYPRILERMTNSAPISQNDPPGSVYHTPQSDWRPSRGFGFTDSNHSYPHAHDSGKGESRFSAEEWQNTLGNRADMFSPPDPMTRDRKSPTKNSRTARPTQRNYAATKDARRDAMHGDINPNIAANMRHVNPGEPHDKTTAFQSEHLPSSFADKVNGQHRESGATPTEPRPENTRFDSDHTNGYGRPTSDEMDIDSPMPPGSGSTTSSESTYNVTVEEERSPAWSNVPRQNVHRHHSASNGIDLNDLAKSAPFARGDGGLKDLKDLEENLPFQSRPSDTLHRTTSSTLRDLNLPRAPKAPQPLADNEIDQKSWERYGDAMTNYMHDWNKFNNAMIEHFRARQEAVTHGMYRNWVCAQGDGATADDFVASGGTDRAGYATYMTWLADDKKCRAWWDVAFEEHRVCMEGLGKVRKRVKELNSGAKGA